MTDSKVLIGIPSFDHVSADFAMSLAALCANRAYDKSLRKTADIALYNVKGTIIHHSRNDIARQALDSGATHLLFLDSDMTFPPDTLSHLLSHHKDIVGADYTRRVPPIRMIGRPIDGADDDAVPLTPMSWMGLGCTLIRTSVLRTIPAPWFDYINKPEVISEDQYFCLLARNNGFPIWRDNSLTAKVGHVGTRIFRPSDID